MNQRFLIKHANQWVEVTAEEFAAHQATSAPPAAKGLGDIVAAVATPIARALKLPCIDPATQQLRPESKCAQRKAFLNNLSVKRSALSVER